MKKITNYSKILLSITVLLFSLSFILPYLFDTDGDGIPDSEEPDDGVMTMAGGSSGFLVYFQAIMVIVIVLIISFVMYSKIKQENLLKNAQRKRILEHIKDNPGKHYRAILKDLDLPMGVLTYHLNRLEKGNFIKIGRAHV